MSERRPTQGPARDLVGYGGRPPRFQWPNGATIAVNLVVNYEEGSELSMGSGDKSGEARGESGRAMPAGVRNMAEDSMYEYGSRAGIWRLLRMFDEYRVPATMYACAMALEANPAVAAAIVKAGHDICGHGYRWTEPWELSRDEERAEIERAIASFQATTGDRPRGWYWRFGSTAHTRELLVEIGGFLYDSDTYNDDLPYWTTVSGKRHLVLPYSVTYNDSQGSRSPQSFLQYCRRGLDEMRREGLAGEPKMMSIGMHPRRTGHAARASALREFIEYAQSLGDVWFARREDIARFWIDHQGELEAKR
jgi:peptidoglycan/xylan/chitin deacetylase (PgdA/CDA1 family)